MNRTFNILAAASLAACALWLVAPAAAAPITSSMGLQNALEPSVETVQYRGGWRGGYGYRGYGYRGYGYRGYGWGPGFVGGALLGGALAAPYYYPPGPYYPGPYYYPGSAYYGSGVGYGDTAAYCMQRFRSYDPRSGTYLGYDGLRHPCP